MIPVVKALSQAFGGGGGGGPSGYISVDTFYGAVATAAADAGAHIINDVSAGRLDPDMLAAIAAMQRPLPYIAMHMYSWHPAPSTLNPHP